MPQDYRPVVLFVCKSNRGKSQMAEALLRARVGDRADIRSAGTEAAVGRAVNSESADTLAEIGADMSDGVPEPVDPAALRRADRVVVLGRAAVLEPVDGMRSSIEVWDTDEPSQRGIEGAERMRLIRDDIDARVRALAVDLLGED